MSATAGKRKVLSTVLWCVAAGVPVVCGGYLIYEKQRTLGADPVPQASAAAGQSAGPATVAVAPSFADPEMLRRKAEQDALLRQDHELRLAKEREALAAAGGSTSRSGKSRVITLGPSANPEQPVERPPEPMPPDPRYARRPSGPQIHEVAEDYRDSERRREAELRQRGIETRPRAPETPLLPFSGTGSGSYESGGYRRTSRGGIRR